MSKHTFSRDEFQAFAVSLAGHSEIVFTQSGRRITTEQFLEGIASKDASLVPVVKAWLAAGKAMGEHIASRQDVSGAKAMKLGI